ncbi:MAG: hypothetical protein FJX80_07575 [Bacteroidetes bacterium]|nr:hypothetical protein [Bacteroidota bacterium]
MKKYFVYFMEEFGGELSQQKTVLAESKEEARDNYLIENKSEKHPLIMVSPVAFFSNPQVFDNPIYQKKKKQIIGTEQKINCEEASEGGPVENNISASFYSTPSFSKADSRKLDKLIELQEKQLFWIRIIGIPFLMAAIGSLIVLIIRMVS